MGPRVTYHVLLAVAADLGAEILPPDVLWSRSSHVAWPHGPAEVRSLKTLADLLAAVREMMDAPLAAPLPRKARAYGVNAGWSGMPPSVRAMLPPRRERPYTAQAVAWGKLPRYAREQSKPEDRIKKVKGGYEVYACL